MKAAKIGHVFAVGPPDGPERTDGEEAGHRVEHPRRAHLQAHHAAQKCTMILPNTCAALHAREAALEIRQRDFGVDHRQKPARHLGEAVADVAHGGAERADDAVLLLKQLHQVERDRGAGGRSAGDEPAAALEHEQRAVEAFGADVLEHDVDALLGRELARIVSNRSVR